MSSGWRGRLVVASLGLTVLTGCGATPSGPAGDPGPALPTLDAQRSDRATGNWNLIHRVDVPHGWRLSDVQVSGETELSDWRRVGLLSDELCGVSVFAGADFTPLPSGREPVTVRGLPGVFLGKPQGYESLSGLWWNYRPGSWASLSCGHGDATISKQDAVALAERVTFRPTKVLLPFRLRAVPAGNRVSYLGWTRLNGAPEFNLDLANTGEDEFPQAPGISMSEQSTTSPASRRAETLTLAGRTAVLDLDLRTLCFPLTGWQACVKGGEDSEPAEPDGDARLRARLLAVGEQLEFATDLDHPAGWFDGDTAAAA